mmetsp:Transcript_8708/g.10104  ORF Transcript_8708/g.10104 Transcript_8708/m.10104 type:complete len:205 (-) Transcript_8708:109-723(-)
MTSIETMNAPPSLQLIGNTMKEELSRELNRSPYVSEGSTMTKSIPNICQSDVPVCLPVSVSPPSSISGGDRNLKAKQQRLLILHHCATCTSPNCETTPHCGKMKSLLRHMAECKTSNCSHRHCSSSRRVLIHFQNCRDKKCETCLPLRAKLMKKRKRRNMASIKAFAKNVKISDRPTKNTKRIRRVSFILPNEEPAIQHPGVGC